MEYEFIFETDFGMEQVVIVAASLREATAKLKLSYPNDHGADGVVHLEDGTERPINW